MGWHDTAPDRWSGAVRWSSAGLIHDCVDTGPDLLTVRRGLHLALRLVDATPVHRAADLVHPLRVHGVPLGSRSGGVRGAPDAATSDLRGRPRGRLRATISPGRRARRPRRPRLAPVEGTREALDTCGARAAEGLGELDTVGGVGDPQLSVVSRRECPRRSSRTPRAGRGARSAASGCHLLARRARWGARVSVCRVWRVVLGGRSVWDRCVAVVISAASAGVVRSGGLAAGTRKAGIPVSGSAASR